LKTDIIDAERDSRVEDFSISLSKKTFDNKEEKKETERKNGEKEMPPSRKLTSSSGSVHLVRRGGKQTHDKDL
jgi:hypothetical protein